MARTTVEPTGKPAVWAAFSKVRWSEDESDANNFAAAALAQSSMDELRNGATAVSRAGAANGLGELPAATGPAIARQAAMTIAEFVEHAFVPEHVATKTLSGRTHYQAILKHVIPPHEVDRVFQARAANSRTKLKAVPNWPYLGKVRLCDARPDDVQRLISAALASGYSTQTVKHIRNVVSAVFAHAKKRPWFTGDNPASQVTLPEMARGEAHALTLDQAKKVFGVMRYPEKEMAQITILTSMKVAEICGLQWKCVNLTEEWSNTHGEPIPPRAIAIRQEWYRGEMVGAGRSSRNRHVPISEPLLRILLALSRRGKFAGPDDFVLVSRSGTPVNENSIARGRLKPIGKHLQIPWLSWRAFRRTHMTLGYELGMQSLADCVAKDH
jgi:integrase